MYRQLPESTRIPKCPRRAWNQNYYTLHIELPNGYDNIEYFEILTSRNSACAFIIAELSNINFPMAAWSYNINRYNENPDEYTADMEAWEENHYGDSDTSTAFYAKGRWYFIDEELTLAGAIAAFRAAPYVEELNHMNPGSVVIFNGYIMYDEDVDYWVADTELPKDVNLDDYKWLNRYNTYIELYPDYEDYILSKYSR